MALRLIIGNKNYSSWSFRPWIAMKVAGIAFEEEVISLDAADFKERVSRVSGTGKVPALVDGRCRYGSLWRFWNIWPRGFRPPAYGPPIRQRVRMRARLPPRCTPASFLCGVICR